MVQRRHSPHAGASGFVPAPSPSVAPPHGWPHLLGDLPGRRCHRIAVVDSHTAGEPTRVVLAGAPDLGTGPLAERCRILTERFDWFRRTVVNEPRGHDVLVGALLVPPADPTCITGTIFFNNVGVLGMCGHGTIGVVTTLAALGRLQPGRHRIETPVGIVAVELLHDGRVRVTNVPSHRSHKDLAVTLPDGTVVRGDVAWGGNWFFLTSDCPIPLRRDRLDALTDYAWTLRRAVNAQGQPQVDHIELVGPPEHPGAQARNFVLCPGRAYDRSPCGTGTSAKLACLAADGLLAPETPWVQESITGSTFVGTYRRLDDRRILPTIAGRAYLCAEANLILEEDDPLCWGLPA